MMLPSLSLSGLNVKALIQKPAQPAQQIAFKYHQAPKHPEVQMQRTQNKQNAPSAHAF